MSKTNKPATLAFDKASPEQVAKVRLVVKEANVNHTYSVSRIYAAHNAVFGLNEQPQTCSSCLTTRARNLTKWLADFDKAATPAQAKKVDAITPVDDKPEAATYDEVVAKYALVLGDDEASERATLGTIVEGGNALNMSAGELALVEARYNEIEPEPAPDVEAVPTTGDKQDEPADVETATTPAANVQRLQAGELVVDFTPSEADPLKGTVKTAEGGSVKTGTHALSDGRKLAVSVGGKAAIKA